MDTNFAQLIEKLPHHWQAHFLKTATENPKESEQRLSLPHVLLSLRDMPYARPSGKNTAEACISQWRGTCSAKHLAAHEWLCLMGYQPQLWMASYIIDFNQPYFSDDLRQKTAGFPVYDVHNFLTCDLGHGEIVIDITFPLRLRRHGFPVTEKWDGRSNFTLCCSPLERIALKADESADEHKRLWLNTLNSDETLLLREAAIQEMMQTASS
ncbi:hypothetical protein ACMHYO_00920 [Allopusillimonas ginsengisoli]|uniref:hypothetical protein n=1 Tax=Allopusillimonas ginsengisoli TaxID=453575 RepID=UPI0010C226C9|nr:hypothetical protein D7I39_09160 [Allopusillimonas ginsengisoli]